ncbi:MAG: energy transducer TonB [Rudaea sp.]|uniref:TonB C-terminal domain-containing protein n=1 Tax=marine sediment metagenome TaxID=412755 RepID=X1HH52_9ZZZZ|nr:MULTISPECIES: energy transducer TonB [unclassified Rudaea]MBN8886676.1 energy transducer TonB [Rudaea sp.]MBR0346718.1 energy transducer TonB [Rudaea sp.]
MRIPAKSLFRGWCRLALAVALTGAAGTAFALERAHLVQPADLSKWWLVSSTGDPKMPSYGKGLTTPTCVAVSYRIERGGATSQIKLEKVVPDGDLGAVAIEIVKGLRYTAAQQNIGKDPVYTYVVLPFNAPDVNKGPGAAAEKQRLLDPCKIDDFKLPPA